MGSLATSEFASFLPSNSSFYSILRLFSPLRLVGLARALRARALQFMRISPLAVLRGGIRCGRRKTGWTLCGFVVILASASCFYLRTRPSTQSLCRIRLFVWIGFVRVSWVLLFLVPFPRVLLVCSCRSHMALLLVDFSIGFSFTSLRTGIFLRTRFVFSCLIYDSSRTGIADCGSSVY